jgi:PAS domain S-box-containing protein
MPQPDAVIAIVDDAPSARAGLSTLMGITARGRSLLLRVEFRSVARCPPVFCLRWVSFASAITLLIGLLVVPLYAQSQPLQYVTTVWQAEQGLPQNSVTAMLQDHQGYLWVGTFGGLARFDGERFTLFESHDLQPLGDNGVLSLYEDHSEVLWIGTLDGGLVRLEHGVATTYTEREGLPSRFVSSISEDRNGKLWFNTSEGLAHFVGARLEAYPTYLGKAVREFFLEARDGSMWFRNGNDVLRFGADGSVAVLNSPKPSRFLVHEARDGSVWIAFRDQYRLVRYYQGVFSDVPLPPIRNRKLTQEGLREYLVYALSMAEDTNGELLLLTPAGLCRIANGSLGPPEPVHLPSKGGELLKVRSLLVDRERNIWVGLNGLGLVRLRPAPLTAYGKEEGIADAGFNAVFQDREGRIWLGGDFLYWFDGNRFNFVPGVENVRAITQTRDGDLWFAGYGGLHRYRSGVLSDFKVPAPDLRAIYQDREGTLWIGALMEEHPGGLFRFRAGKLDQIPGISDVNQIVEDRDGGLWVGGVKELIHMQGEKTVRYDQKQGLPERSVDLHQDSTGALWIASYGGGLTRLRNGRLRTITTKDGLPNNMLAGLLEDRQGDLWISSTQNIFCVSLKQLNDLADGRISSVLPVSYGIAEGMRSSESDVGSPAGWETSDSRIWFPTMRGVVVIDPKAGNHLSPPVIVEEAWANKVALGHDAMTSAPPGNNTFDFRFTALSFSNPDKLRFKYRLEPFDKDWVDAGTHRTAHYTNMSPGEYSFHVLAANTFGIWSDQEAGVRFALLPHFYQTNWFRAICVTTFLALVWGLYRFRIRQLRTQEEKFREAIQTMPGLAFVARSDGYRTFVNKGWVDYTGIPLEQASGSGWQAAIHSDDLKRVLDKWRSSVAKGDAFEYETRQRRGADSEYRWFQVRVVPVRDRRGKVVKWCGLATDIEDSKRAEQERERLHQLEAELAHINRVSMLGELTASIAHEVNQPLSGVVSNGSACLRWMGGEMPNMEEAREAARRIVRDGKRAAEVIARIRSMTKKNGARREKLDLNQIVQEVIALVSDEAKKHWVVIRTEFSDDVFAVLGDRVQLQQVVLNLVMNGIEAMSSVSEQGRELMISTQNVDSNQAQVTIRDFGIGLDPNAMPKIFEPFYTTKPSGMGMGLSICRSILRAHGGELWAAVNEGPGTTFHFKLPRHAEGSHAAA